MAVGRLLIENAQNETRLLRTTSVDDIVNERFENDFAGPENRGVPPTIVRTTKALDYTDRTQGG